MEQPQYNLLHRDQVEKECARLYAEDIGLGLTTWSPLAGGILTGRSTSTASHQSSRATLKGHDYLCRPQKTAGAGGPACEGRR